jgi:hypothetical protein
MRTRPAACLILLAATFLLIARANEPVKQTDSMDELARIIHFFEYSANKEPAVLGRILKNETKDLRTPGGVSVDGTSVTVYHTLERTTDGLRLKQSTVHDTMLYDLDKTGARIEPGKSGYRIEVAEIELHKVEGGSRVQGYLRDISNSRFDPVGWSVEIRDARVTGQERGKRGSLVLKEREVGSSGKFAKGGRMTATTWEAEVIIELAKDGRLITTFTTTSFDVDSETGARTKVKADPINKIENPSIITFRER